MENDVYLGDGLYASYDGFMIRLWTERGGLIHEVYLEPEVFATLLTFASRIFDPVKLKQIIDREVARASEEGG